MRGSVGLGIAGILFAARLFAQERTTWPLVVNEEPKGEIQLVLRDDGPWVAPADLAKAGLQHLPEGNRQALFPDSNSWVSLASLAPSVSYRIDENQIRLEITADPVVFASRTFRINTPRPPGWAVKSSTTAFLNYSVQWSRSGGVAGYGEVATRFLGQLLSTSASFSNGGRMTPGFSNWTIDQVRHQRRWVFGDTFGRATTLGSSPVVGGFSIATEDALDPYHVSYPSPAINGLVRTPSSADIYVNGRQVSRLKLSPGPFSLDDLPVESGRGKVDVVLRDSFGREQRVNLGFYLAPSLLKRGEKDYSYVVGWEREAGEGVLKYDQPVATGYQRVGVSDSVTIGAQGEARYTRQGVEVAAGGVGALSRVGRLGIVGGEVLVSRQAQHGTGYAATVGYSFIGPIASFDLRGTWVGPRFANLSLESVDKPQTYLDATSSVSLGRLGSLSVGKSKGTGERFLSRVTQPTPDYAGHVGPPTPKSTSSPVEAIERTLRLSYSTSITSRLQFSITATQSRLTGNPTIWTGFCSLSLLLRRATTVTSITSIDDYGKTSTAITLQKSLPVGPGYGYRVETDTREPSRASGSFDLQHRHGVISVGANGSKGQPVDAEVTVAGGIVTIGREVLLTRPVDDAFVLVRVPQTKGVRVLANNEVAARTSRRGTAFVPDIRSYLSNSIGIEQNDVPVTVRLGAVEQQIAVPYRGGAVVTFEADVIRALTGRLDVRGEAPAFGTLSVDAEGKRFDSPLNAVGEFYFEDLPPGEHEGVARWKDRVCRVTIRMPTGLAALNDQGRIPCLEESR